MLIKPVQRIMKYELIMKDILKHTKRAGLVKEADELERAMGIIRVSLNLFNVCLKDDVLNAFCMLYFYRVLSKQLTT